MRRVAVIGSSPQLIVEAIRLARAGSAVTVLEGREMLGGAWAVTEFAGYRRVEVACHLLERDADGYAALEALGVALAPMDPQPRTVLRPGMSRAYTAPFTAAAQLAYYPVARTRRRRELNKSAWQRRRRLATKELVDSVTDRSPVLGLVGGAGDLVDSLVAAADAADVEVRSQARVTRITVGSSSPSVEVLGDAEFYDEVVVSAAFSPEKLIVDGVAVGGPVRRRSYAHRLMALPAGSVTAHSYLRFPRDPVLQRCSDVTHAAVAAGPDAAASLLLASVRCDEEGAPIHGLADTLARLREHGVIGDVEPSADLLLRYEGRDGSATLRAGLGSHTSVAVLDSFGDLTRAIASLSPSDASARSVTT